MTLRKTLEISEDALAALFSQPLEQLEIINLDECPNLTDQVLEQISINCPNLIKFKTNWADKVQYIGIKLLFGRCFNLRRVDLQGMKRVNDDSFTPFLPDPKHPEKKPLKSCFPTLRYLNFQSSDFVSDDIMLRIKTLYPLITVINYYNDEVLI